MTSNGIGRICLLLALIVVARIADVSMGTLRVVCISRGRRSAAALCGFFEVLIWITVISQVLSGVQHWLAYVAYAAGYATGTLVGMWVEERLALGWAVVRLITNKPSDAFVSELREAGFRVTVAPAEGRHGQVRIIFTTVRRKRVRLLRQMLADFDANAFFTIEDVREVRQDVAGTAVARTGAGKRPLP